MSELSRLVTSTHPIEQAAGLAIIARIEAGVRTLPAPVVEHDTAALLAFLKPVIRQGV